MRAACLLSPSIPSRRLRFQELLLLVLRVVMLLLLALAFLGAGHTHQSGDYQDTVRRGLEVEREFRECDPEIVVESCGIVACAVPALRFKRNEDFSIGG